MCRQIEVESQPLPRSHRSAFEVVEPFPGASGCEERLASRLQEHVESEVTFFAASRPFAEAHAGPLTRAFLEALPTEWAGDVVIHSSLVWLTQGLAHDETFALAERGAPHRVAPPFRHEPFPGAAFGARRDCNLALEARHRIAVTGDPAPVFAVGAIELDPLERAESFWLPTEDLRTRDRRIRRWLEGGEMAAVSLPRETIVEHGWGAFWCPQPALSPGFQLVIRATLGSAAPIVDGIRNMSFL
ncbi:hypothetical protein Poly30_37000 [Planctomycetes bacterium Poly30]|uniref:Uncharacterized protein n=1 Tax=Saltatorellus ferox TaxID=2528018 RepID=A0A518EVR6_9BACT|nr:hypothetical protein Poly30_37000 [Planctomycetes bacterium Poly30]